MIVFGLVIVHSEFSHRFFSIAVAETIVVAAMLA